MAEQGQPSKAQRLVEGLADRRERHRARGRIYRGAVVLAGVIVLLAGLAMTVLPGPAVVVIPIGLSLLALEFVWAETILQKLADGADFALSRRPPRRALIAAAVVLVLGVATFVATEAL
jgi:uncharacterized protein (TIGR02611 family)